MGAGVGVHNNEELQDLAPDQIAELKEEVLRQVSNILPEIMEDHPDIRDKVKAAVRPTLDRLKNQ